jgi:hypothetical protein
MENRREERDEQLEELTKVQGDFEAQLIKGMLESEGIGVDVRTGVCQSILPMTVNGLGEMRLFVLAKDLPAAKLLLEAYRSGK